MLKELLPNLKRGCAGLVAGWAVLIAQTNYLKNTTLIISPYMSNEAEVKHVKANPRSKGASNGAGRDKHIYVINFGFCSETRYWRGSITQNNANEPIIVVAQYDLNLFSKKS